MEPRPTPPPMPLPTSPPDHLFVTVAFVTLGACLAVSVFDRENPLVLLVAGAALGWIGAIVSYRYGSSAGSERKTEALVNRSASDSRSNESRAIGGGAVQVTTGGPTTVQEAAPAPPETPIPFSRRTSLGPMDPPPPSDLPHPETL